MAIRRLALLVFCSSLASCGLVDSLSSQPPIVAKLEVFNRTEEAIFLVSADGERLDVPACGRAIGHDFRVDAVEVRTARGYVHGFGYGADEARGAHLVLVATGDPVSDVPTIGPAPDRLPRCKDRPPAQEGV